MWAHHVDLVGGTGACNYIKWNIKWIFIRTLQTKEKLFFLWEQLLDTCDSQVACIYNQNDGNIPYIFIMTHFQNLRKLYLCTITLKDHDCTSTSTNTRQGSWNICPSKVYPTSTFLSSTWASPPFFQINIYFGYNFEKRVYVLTSTDFASCEKKPDIVWSVLYFNISILYLHQSSSLLFCFMFTPILSVWYIWNGNVCDKVPYVNLLKWSSDLVIIPT